MDSMEYHLGVRLPVDLAEQLRKAAVAEQRSVSGLARNIIAEWLAKQTKPGRRQ